MGACCLAAIAGDTILVPCHVIKALQPFEDWAPVDELYGCLIFKWVAEMTSMV